MSTAQEEMLADSRRSAGDCAVGGTPQQARSAAARLSGFVQLSRPFTMIAAFVAGLSIVLLYSRHYGMRVDWSRAIAAGAVMALLQAAGQAMNQSIREEVAIDQANGKGGRPTVTGLVSLREGKLFAVLLVTTAVAWALSLTVAFGLGSLAVGLFAVFYTLPPVRAKKRFLLNNLWQGFSRGFLPWVTVWSLSGRLAVLPFAMGTVVGLWVAGYQTTKDFGDVAGDRRYGVRTMPVVYGIEGSVRFMGWMAACSFLALAVVLFLGLLPRTFALLMVLTVPSVIILLKVRAPRTSPVFENGPSWGLMYITLGLFYLLPVVVVRL